MFMLLSYLLLVESIVQISHDEMTLKKGKQNALCFCIFWYFLVQINQKKVFLFNVRISHIMKLDV